MNHCKFLIITMLLIAGMSSKSQSWQQKVDFTIDVSLNDHEHTLDGFVRMLYTNNSPDTLSFIWIHCWPNAFKTDRTAFSDQLLDNGRTDFYFSDKGQRGYINHLDFRVDGQAARIEDHPQYIDIIRVWLPKPLLPGASSTITTPFHEQLPDNFSRGGHVGRSYQVTQWYPKPAVYDRKGWHEMPYLDQGEFFNEFGNYDVRITLPQNYTVAAPGALQPGSDSPTGISAKPSTPRKLPPSRKPIHKPVPAHKPVPVYQPAPAKTLHYIQENAIDFAWFADPRYHTDHDTLTLPSGRIIDCYAYYLPASTPVWRNSITFIKDAIRFRTALIGEYPYNTVSIAEAKTGTAGGMEYPAIASISPTTTPRELDLLIEHEIGHNWFQATLASDERSYPWMDEGINTYYDKRYEAAKYPDFATSNSRFVSNKLPDDLNRFYLDVIAAQKKDQPINTPSQDFSESNYDIIAYDKAGYWLQELQDSIGPERFDACMREYYRHWQFHHPAPQDFRQSLETTTARDLGPLFAKLDRTGPVTPQPAHKTTRLTFLFNARHADSVNYISLSPAFAYNKYDGFMIGGLIHNYNLLPKDFQYAVAGLYATASHQLNAVGRASYTWHPDAKSNKIEAGINGERFSSSMATDSNNHKLFGGYYKLAPYIRITFPTANPRSTVEKWLEWKTYLIGENQPGDYVRKTADSLYYPARVSNYNFRYLNQLAAQTSDTRVLYPYSANLQIQQADRFYRVNLEGKYYFNYPAGGGMHIRLFAAKFGYLGGQSGSIDLSRFQPKLTGISGAEDYTYSNYFLGRNEYTGFSSQQIMDRDGGLKIRVPNFPWLEGRSDNWVSSMNFNTTLPRSIAPEWLPLTIFFDIGTYSGAWQSDPLTSHFLYTGGFQLSLLNDVIHFYAPIVYSSDFRDQLKTIPDQNSFWKRLSFSIQLQNLNFKKLFNYGH